MIIRAMVKQAFIRYLRLNYGGRVLCSDTYSLNSILFYIPVLTRPVTRSSISLSFKPIPRTPRLADVTLSTTECPP